MKSRLPILIVSLFVLSLAARAADDPLVGTWNLNVAKSKYSSGQVPQRQTLKFEPFGTGLKLTNQVMNAQGTQTSFPSIYVFDGQDYGIPYTPFSFTNRRIDANTTERVIKNGANAMVTTRRVVSKDGKTLTITHAGKDSAGKDVSATLVYGKQ